MKKKLIYTGSRTANNKKTFSYIEFEEPNKEVYFKSKIAKIESIGNIIESDVEEKTYSKSTIIGHIKSNHKCFKQLLEWEVLQRCSIEELTIISEAKKQNSELELIISKLEFVTYGLTHRQKARMARYVFERIMKY